MSAVIGSEFGSQFGGQFGGQFGSQFGEVLRGWRTRRRLSQLDLAAEAGTTQRHLSFLEQGRSTPGRTSSSVWRTRFS